MLLLLIKNFKLRPEITLLESIFVTLIFVEVLAQRKRKQVSSPSVLSPLRSESVSFVAERGNETKKGNDIADDLIEPRRGGENTGRRWSEAKPLQISQESILNPDGVTEILSDLREGGLSPASPPALSKKGGSSASRTKASPSSPSVAPPYIRSALRDLYTCGPP